MRLEVGVLLVGERHGGGILHLLLVLLHGGLVDLDLRRGESGSSDELLRAALTPNDRP